ncbi:MAG TPA: hypothetical protein VGK16_15935 [Candidatus Limnocylindrales bacterium]
MDNDQVRFGVLRDVLAFVIVAVACPVAVFGGSAAGCIGQGGFQAECALNGVWIAPLLLFVAGIAAGLVTRGWTGLLVVFVGTVVGMVSILLLSFAVGRPVPVDPISGFIATVWFLGPIAAGYAGGRIAWRLLRRRTPPAA